MLWWLSHVDCGIRTPSFVNFVFFLRCTMISNRDRSTLTGLTKYPFFTSQLHQMKSLTKYMASLQKNCGEKGFTWEPRDQNSSILYLELICQKMRVFILQLWCLYYIFVYWCGWISFFVSSFSIYLCFFFSFIFRVFFVSPFLGGERRNKGRKEI